MAKAIRTVRDLALFLAAEEKELLKLSERREQLASALDALAGEITQLKGEAGIEPAAPKRRARRRRRRRRRGEKTVREIVAGILRKAGRPMRAPEIAPLLLAAGCKTRSKNPVNMVSAILGQSPNFKRVGKGLYTVR